MNTDTGEIKTLQRSESMNLERSLKNDNQNKRD